MAIALVPDLQAVEIVTHFIGGAAPANAVGDGNLVDIFNSAARTWGRAYADSFTVVLNFGWAPLGDAGTHTLVEQGGVPNRELVGLILFDNSGSCPFYMDATPDSNEEYRRYTEEMQDLGGGMTNVARLFSQPSGDAVDRTDLVTVALHEIGHALGMCNGNARFVESGRPGVLTVAAGLPFGGTVIPLAHNRSGVTSHFDPTLVAYGSLMSGLCAGERRMPSALDVLANAQVSGLELSTLDPMHLPAREPAPSLQTAPGNLSSRSNPR